MIATNSMKPWFKDDFARALMGVYLASYTAKPPEAKNNDFRRGFAVALASMAVVVGVNPESFLVSEDLLMLQEPSLRRLEGF
jgi:hypothetical protein